MVRNSEPLVFDSTEGESGGQGLKEYLEWSGSRNREPLLAEASSPQILKSPSMQAEVKEKRSGIWDDSHLEKPPGWAMRGGDRVLMPEM